MSKPVFHIAIALVRRGDHWLVAQRPAAAHLGGLWEFPGGKTHAGETARQAALRELREECAVEAAALLELPPVRCEYAERVVHITPVLCRWDHGDPQPLASAACGWVTTDQLRKLHMPAVNQSILAAAVAALAQRETTEPSA